MTIKIIGEDKTKAKRTTCANCAALLEYTIADTETKLIRDYGGGSDTYRFLVCPRCQAKLSVAL